MTLWNPLRDAFGVGPKLRNKPGGMAYIRMQQVGGGDEMLDGRIVKTVRTFTNGGLTFWLIEPFQAYTATAHSYWPHNGRRRLPGEKVTISGLADECLVPLEDPGDEERDESAQWLPPVPSVSPHPVKEVA